ncbi:6-phosphogluconolactonase [Mucilaginibacter sp. AK015]|uniref:6-phosphogluconolactonase n=1 Tax=Mucilaginibacter sp. AK015 TaxID=2723072 RepID=UPI001618481C|nr:6-phosphogluconolactonase [Mucilaginibacter sp. AK015]MBB5397214.1 6-phosphogluconolactonase [Mucilaginibacter sp. AK015]
MKLNIFKTDTEVLASLAQYFADCAKEAIEARDRFTVALSGGSSPKKLHQLLASDYRDTIDWDKVYFFFGDERDVPLTDAQSNYLMAKQTLFDPLEIEPSHVFAVQTHLGAEEAAIDYTRNLIHFFDGHNACFDLVILGLGDNSHTASLFPHTSVLTDDSASVQALYIDEVKMNRITFTAPLINNAHHIAFLVYGAGKAAAVKHILEDPKDIQEYPAQLIKGKDLQWFLDQPAAAKLEKK